MHRGTCPMDPLITTKSFRLKFLWSCFSSPTKDTRELLEQLFLGFRYRGTEPEEPACRLCHGTRTSEDTIAQALAFRGRQCSGKGRRVSRPGFEHGGWRRVRQPALHELTGWAVNTNARRPKAGDNGVPFLGVQGAVGPPDGDQRHQ